MFAVEAGVEVEREHAGQRVDAAGDARGREQRRQQQPGDADGQARRDEVREDLVGLVGSAGRPCARRRRTAKARRVVSRQTTITTPMMLTANDRLAALHVAGGEVALERHLVADVVRQVGGRDADEDRPDGERRPWGRARS